MAEFLERLYPLLPTESSIRRVLILATPAYQVPEDNPGFKYSLVVGMIKTIGGTAYDEINGMGKATASLPESIEWTVFR